MAPEREPAPQPITLYTWWNEAGERGARDALEACFERLNPELVNTIQFEGNLESTTACKAEGPSISNIVRCETWRAMFGPSPPNTFQANAGADLQRWLYHDDGDYEEGQELLQELDSLPELDEFWAKVPEAVRRAVSPSDDSLGPYLAVPLNIHRINLLFYSIALFEHLDAKDPQAHLLDRIQPGSNTTIESATELVDVCQRIREHDPLAIPIGLGVLEDAYPLVMLVFENLLLSQAGAEQYESLFTAPAIDFARDKEPVLRELLTVANQVFDACTTREHSENLKWDAAINEFVSGRAGSGVGPTYMLVSADWALGTIKVASEENGAGDFDLGERAMPGTSKYFVFTSDTFPLTRRALGQREARKLLYSMTTEDCQLSFNHEKGSVPARRIDEDRLGSAGASSDSSDARLRRVHELFHSKDVEHVLALSGLVPPRYLKEIQEALLAFYIDGEADDVVYRMRNYDDMLGNEVH